MHGQMPNGNVVLVVSTSSGCKITVCDGSNCANSTFTNIGPAIQTDYCQLESSDTLGRGGVIFVSAMIRNALVLMSVEANSPRNITSWGFTAIGLVASRGVALLRRSSDYAPYAVTPCDRKLCMAVCQDITCRAAALQTTMLNISSPSLVLRGAAVSNTSALYLLMHDSIDNKTASLLYCSTGNFSTCNSTWQNLTSAFNFVRDGFMVASAQTYGPKNIQIDEFTHLPWFSLHTSLKTLIYSCVDVSCNSTKLIWSVSLLPTLGSQIQPDWVVYYPGTPLVPSPSSAVLVLIQPQVGPPSTRVGVLTDGAIRATTCFQGGRACETYSIWRGKTMFGCSLSIQRSEGNIIMSAETLESDGMQLSVSRMTAFCAPDEISSIETAGECIKCPAGSYRSNATLCAVCDRKSGFSSAPGSSSCSLCSNSTDLGGGCSFCASGTSLSNTSCAVCPGKSYSSPSSHGVCLSCPLSSIISPDSVQCLDSDSALPAIYQSTLRMYPANQPLCPHRFA
jgi:hypothetical protein